MNIPVGVILLGTGLLMLFLALPLLKGKVSMNRLYGVRFREAFDSEEAWYRINRYGAKQLIAGAIFLIVAGAATTIYPVSIESTAGIAWMLTIPAVALVGAGFTHRYAKSLQAS